MRILVDTNIFLDYLLDRENAEEVKKFFLYCYKLKNQLYVTTLSLRDIGYVVHHYTHNKKDALKAQMSVYQICSKILDITADDAINSLFSDMPDFEDSLQKESAERNMLDVIVTNDKKDYKDCGMAVLPLRVINEIFENTLS